MSGLARSRPAGGFAVFNPRTRKVGGWRLLWRRITPARKGSSVVDHLADLAQEDAVHLSVRNGRITANGEIELLRSGYDQRLGGAGWLEISLPQGLEAQGIKMLLDALADRSVQSAQRFLLEQLEVPMLIDAARTFSTGFYEGLRNGEEAFEEDLTKFLVDPLQGQLSIAAWLNARANELGLDRYFAYTVDGYLVTGTFEEIATGLGFSRFDVGGVGLYGRCLRLEIETMKRGGAIAGLLHELRQMFSRQRIELGNESIGMIGPARLDSTASDVGTAPTAIPEPAIEPLTSRADFYGVVVGKVGGLFSKYRLSQALLLKIFGKGFADIQYLTLTDACFNFLDKHPVVKALRNPLAFEYALVGGFALYPGSDRLLDAILLALGVEERLTLPVVFLRRGESIDTLGHEMAHATNKLGKGETPPENMCQYVRLSSEKDAFFCGILLYRCLYPAHTFYDYVRSEMRNEVAQLSDVELDCWVRENPYTSFNLGRLIWRMIDQQIREGRTIEDCVDVLRASVLQKPPFGLQNALKVSGVAFGTGGGAFAKVSLEMQEDFYYAVMAAGVREVQIDEGVDFSSGPFLSQLIVHLNNAESQVRQYIDNVGGEPREGLNIRLVGGRLKVKAYSLKA